MNGQFDDELLSAYHDGELSDTERQSVADQIADEPGLREVVDEYAELSSSLKSLPRTAAPDDLHAGVMRQVRELTVVVPPAQASGPSPRQVWFWAAGSVASLLIAVSVIVWTRRPPVNPGIAAAGAMSDSGGPANAADESRKVALRQAFDSGSGSTASEAPAEVPAVPALAAPFPMELDSGPFATDPQLQEMLDSLSQEPESGEQLQLLQRVNDELVLVEYRVVDVNHAFGEAQVLLQKLGMKPISGDADLVRAASENRLQGIFLEAPREETVAVLGQIDSLENVVLTDDMKEDLVRELGMDPGELPPAAGFDRSPASPATADAAAEPARVVRSSPVPADSPAAATPPPAGNSQSGAVTSQSEPASARYQALELNGNALRAIEVRQQEGRGPQGQAGNREEPGAGRSVSDRARILIVFIRDEEAGKE